MTVWPASPTAAQITSVTTASSTPPGDYTTGSVTGSGGISTAELNQPTIPPADDPDHYEVPQNDPHAVAGQSFDPYGDACQSGLFRLWHIIVIWFALAARAESFSEIPSPESRPFWLDHKWAGQIAALLGFILGRIAEVDAVKDPEPCPAALKPDPALGYTVDPWNKPEDLEDLPDAIIIKHATGVEIICHTRRQREVARLAGIYGRYARSLKDIPECPPRFQDVGHYWYGASLAEWEVYHSSYLRKFKNGVVYLVLDSAGNLDVKNVVAMITLVLGTAETSNGTVSHLLKLIGIA